MTLIEVIDTARSLLSEPLDSARSFPDNSSGFWADNAFTDYFNLVQEEIQNEIIQTYEDYFLTQTFLNVTDGCASYLLPSAVIKVRLLEDVRGDGDGVPIEPVTITNRANNNNTGFVLSSASFREQGYYLRGSELILTNTPNFTDASALQLHFVKRMTRVSAATGTSELPAEHHGTLVWGIVKYAQFQQQADTTLAEAEYQRRKRDLKKFAENRQIQKPRRVKSTYGDTD